MAVIRHYSTNEILAHDHTGRTRGSERKGIRAGDWLSETTGILEKMKNPKFEKPANLIESIRILDDGEMSAKSWAVAEYAFANARREGIENDHWDLPMSVLSKYLEIAETRRIEPMLNACAKTLVRYDVRDGTKRIRTVQPILTYELHEETRIGKSILRYRLPDVVKTAVLRSQHYTWLDINVFARFKSKYSARLYEKLALMAGKDDDLRSSWEPTPTELAEYLGFPIPKDKPLHFGTFHRAVERAMEDVNEHVIQFNVRMSPPDRQSTKGRPRGKYVFDTSRSDKELKHQQITRLRAADFAEMEDKVVFVDKAEIPSVGIIGRAATMLSLDTTLIIRVWKFWLLKARKNDPRKGGSGDIGPEFMVLSTLEKDGVDVAFATWLPILTKMKLQDKLKDYHELAPERTPTHTPTPAASVTTEEPPKEDRMTKLRRLLKETCDEAPARIDRVRSSAGWCDIDVIGQTSIPFIYGDETADRVRRALQLLGKLISERVRRERLLKLLAAIGSFDNEDVNKVCDFIFGGTVDDPTDKPKVYSSSLFAI